jgi:hypothetical protein
MDIIDYRNRTRRVEVDLDNTQNLWTISDKRPQIEKDLTALQRKYYKTRDKKIKHKIWQEMFILVQKYGRSLILKKKQGGGKYIDPDIIEDQSIQVAITFMSQYINKPGFFVGVSFAGMMNGKVLEALYKQLPDDDNYSLNETMGDSDHEFEDIQGTETIQSIFNEMPLPEDTLNNVNLTDVLNDLFEEFDSQVDDEKIKLKLRFYIFILLRRPRNKHIFPTFFKYQCNKTELDLIQLFELELFNRLKEISE